MTKISPTFLILDGNALLHRAWHALPPLTTKEGLVVNAAYGFAMVVEKMREQYEPDYMAVAWDLPGKTFRHEKFAAYKATRAKKEQELYDQIPLIQDLLEAFHIPSLDAVGYEADDIIGTLSAQADKKGYQTLIVTGDLDALQLVSEKTHVVFFQKGISETKRYDEKAVQERYGLSPSQLIDYKALRGDASDNIPGVSGIGEKTATILVKTYGTVEGILHALAEGTIEEKVAKKLKGNEEVAREARELVSIVRDVKLDFSFARAKTREPNWDSVLDQYQKLEFKTLLRKHQREAGETKKTIMKTSSRMSVVRDEKELAATLETMAEHQGVIALLIADQQPDLFGATMAALAVSDGNSTIVIPNPSEKHLAVLRDAMVRFDQLVTHDLKRLFHQLSGSLHNCFDTLLGAYVLNSSARSYDLPSLLSAYLHIKVNPLPEAFASQKDYEQLGTVVSYLPKLCEVLNASLEKTGARSIFEEIELPLVPVLFRMETVGVLLDTDALSHFSHDVQARIRTLEKQIRAIAGEEINVNSPIQLAQVLFEKLKLTTKGIKKTKTGFSTAASELEKLWDQHEVIPLISEHRELAKLQSTYVETLPKLVDANGRVHTTYNQTVAATGRLSSSDPNLQNIPIKTELGREIRKAFVAPRGKRLIAADYSQIELRLAAIIANDKPFIDAFQSGADIHTRTAADVWDVAESEVTKEQRRAAKAINFGILYGMGSRSLSRSTGLSLGEAKIFIERYFEIHHAIKQYLDETKRKAHEDGYVETLFGRRRYFPEINSGVQMLVAQAERMAINMPVQGTAADLMKKAMLAVDGWIQQTQLPIALLLQVHDELVLEVDHTHVETAARGIKQLMEGVATFAVPLVVDVEVGKNWGEMETI